MLQDAHQHLPKPNIPYPGKHAELRAESQANLSVQPYQIHDRQCTGLDYSQLVPTQHIAADRLVMSCYFQYLWWCYLPVLTVSSLFRGLLRFLSLSSGLLLVLKFSGFFRAICFFS